MTNIIRMKFTTLILRTVAVLFVFTLMLSCENDFQPLGSNIVDSTNFKSDSLSLPVTTYTKRFFDTLGVQTNSTSVGSIGIYNDPVYGTTTASSLSQVVLSRSNPVFGDNVVLDSVIFSMPYFSTSSIDAEGNTEYTLDSVYGDTPMNLIAYRSNYFLGDNTPPDFEDRAIYYSNQLSDFQGIEGDSLFAAENFVPSNKPVRTDLPAAADAEDQSAVITYTEPALRLSLGTEYWKQAIIDKGGDNVLFNDNNFKNYFRGIYFKVQPLTNNKGSYFLYNLSATKITLYYRYGTNEPTTSGTLDLQLYSTSESGGLRTISLTGLDNSFKPQITDAVGTPDMENGDEDLYLKGGQGSMAVIDLFGPDDNNDGIPERLETLRDSTWLIREANLTFYVDQSKISALGGQNYDEPKRLYIYNLDTNQPLVDYTFEATAGASGADGITNHLGPLTRDASGKGVSYKIRITEYLKSLLNSSNENPATKLGLVVSQNVGLTSTGSIEGTSAEDKPNRVPFGSILSQKGTILYGNQGADESKQVKLNIYYTSSSSN